MDERKQKEEKMRRLAKGLALSAVASSVVLAGGYKIPEQSLNSMALSAAYVAHTTGADTAYFNPANMVFMGEKQYLEGALTLAHLPKIDYYGIAQTKRENIVIPAIHYVSEPMGDLRWGISVTAPGGLSKRWENQPGRAYAEEFTLKIVEINPSLAYRISDNFSIGAGIRVLYSEGVVKSDASGLPVPIVLKRDMEGDTVEFGYNLAVTYRPTEDMTLAATYRSNIDIDESGTARLYANGTEVYNGGANVSVPLPAALNLSVSKTWNTLTLELNYERTFWSTYETLDFNYDSAIPGSLVPYFDAPIDKNWKDTNTFRLGATMVFDKLTMMMGFAIDETPVPDKTISFELPDSDAKIVSLGFRYQQTESLSWGAAFLYDSKEPMTVAAGVADNPVLNQNGASFNGGGAYLTTVGMAYEF
jgi:long-chain fatty acid transport protein